MYPKDAQHNRMSALCQLRFEIAGPVRRLYSYPIRGIAFAAGKNRELNVIASEARQSRDVQRKRQLDCFVAVAPRNDGQGGMRKWK
jgi:hypothetical protein